MYICTNTYTMSSKLEEFDESKLINNPFINSLLIPVTRTYSPNQYTFHSPVNGEIGTFLPTGFYLDKIQSSRLYYSAGSKEMVYNLTDRAQRLYIYILYNLVKGKDYVQINKENYMKKNNIKSRITYAAAIDELIRYGFIVKTIYKTVYWTNPLLFSSSNRIKMYPNKLEVKNEI